MGEVPTLIDFLTQLGTGGAVGVVIAFLLEEIGIFQSLKPEVKRWAVLALFIGIPTVATALLQFVPPDVWVVLEPFWKAVALGFIGWVSSQVAYTLRKRNGKKKF